MTKTIKLGISNTDENNTTKAIDLSILSTVTSIKNIPDYDFNPFTVNFKYSKRKYYDKVENIRLQVGDEIITNKILAKENLVLAEKLYKDNEPFCKLFTKQELFNIDKISPSTCKMLLFILFETTNLNTDYIILNPKSFSERLDLSINTIYNCIVELCVNYMIVKKTNEDTIYWINPYIFFKGDRKKIKYRTII